MPRQKRAEIPGGYYHITSRGNGGDLLFRDDEDFAIFAGFLAQTVPRFGWRCFAYCLIPNHYHVVLQITTQTLASGMRRLNGRYAHLHNRRHDRTGHLFGDRYRTTFIESDDHLAEACRYVDLNPVRAGLCAHPAEWAWSSYAEIPHRSFLSRQVVDSFGGPAGYAAYVEEQLAGILAERRSPVRVRPQV